MTIFSRVRTGFENFHFLNAVDILFQKFDIYLQLRENNLQEHYNNDKVDLT